jgi:hypothetical protein
MEYLIKTYIGFKFIKLENAKPKSNEMLFNLKIANWQFFVTFKEFKIGSNSGGEGGIRISSPSGGPG